MRVPLNIVERVLLFGLINVHPEFQQSSAMNFRMRDAALHVLSLEDSDRQVFGIREEKEGDKSTMFFDNKELCMKDVVYTLPDPLMADVARVLRTLDNEKKLTPDQYKLWEKLMPEEDKKKLAEGFNAEEFKRVEPTA